MRGAARVLAAFVVGQVALHAGMAGLRMSTPLQALHDGRTPAAVGILLALFALAPVALALPAGRLADRHGYHRPLKVAVGLTSAGGLLAVASTFASGPAQLALLAAAAMSAGAGANVGMISIQRAAGRSAEDTTALKRVFAWLGLAPALANMIGPMLAGALIDAAGFRVAFAALAALPLAGLGVARLVPREPRVARAAVAPGERGPWRLLRTPGLGRLLFVNWLLSASWDVHSFVLPVLGHERGFSASAIGLVLGVFAGSVAGVRALIPWVAQRLREATVIVAAMLVTAGVFGVYPLMRGAGGMAACAALLGVALGAVQPMVMATLHQLTPHERHGEAIALRSMTINASSTLMPLLFGAVGTALGAGALFWLMAAAVGAGSLAARRVGAPGS